MMRAAERSNVLFLFADDQRADTIAALGNPVIQTPNLDRLVKRGVAFDRAYMQGGLQGATCVPSRAMLLSGRTLFRIDEKLKRDPTWPAAFGRAGYTTFMSGKWHNGPDSIPASFQIARSVFAGGMTNPMQAKLSDMVDGKLGNARTGTRSTPARSSPTRRFASSRSTRAGRSSATCRSTPRTIRTSCRRISRSATTPPRCRCRRTSCRSIPGTTAR